MNKTKSLILIASVVLACVVAQQVESKRHSSEAAAVANFGFGLKTAGTYLGEFVVPTPDGGEITLPILNTFHADGTFVDSVGDMFGGGDPGFNGLRSPFHGTWTRSGPREIQWTGLVFIFDDLGNLGAPVYFGGGFLRVTGETRWDEDYQNMEGESLLEVFMPDQDPLCDDAVLAIPSTFTMRRVNAQ